MWYRGEKILLYHKGEKYFVWWVPFLIFLCGMYCEDKTQFCFILFYSQYDFFILMQLVCVCVCVLLYFFKDSFIPPPLDTNVPQEVRSPDDHVLEVLQRQSSVVVQVGLVDHLLTNHSHLVLRQLVASEFVQCLLQVWLADKVVIVEVCQRHALGLSVDSHF